MNAVEHRRFLGQNLGVLDENFPFKWVTLLQVSERGDTGALVFFTNDLA
jgi:hypothetical protein